MTDEAALAPNTSGAGAPAGESGEPARRPSSGCTAADSGEAVRPDAASADHRSGNDAGEPLPARLVPLFWDHDPARLAWPADRALITTRVLAKGGLDAWRWLRRRVPDAELAVWIRRRRGRGLSPERLRFWQLVLGLPAAEVDGWLAARAEDPWYDRRHRHFCEEPG